MSGTRLQDYFGGMTSHCFGCGTENAQGIGIRTYWEGDEGVTRFVPGDHLQGFPGLMQGGMLGVAMDCTMTSTGTAHACGTLGIAAGDEGKPVYVTANMTVDYLKPTPVGRMLELRARIVEHAGRKLTVACSAWVDGVETARGTQLMVRVEPPKPSQGGV